MFNRLKHEANNSKKETDNLSYLPNTMSLRLWRGVVLLVCIIWSTNFSIIKEIQNQNVPKLDASLYGLFRFEVIMITIDKPF